MTNHHRFFVNYPTDNDGSPNLGDPSYFRVTDQSALFGLPSGKLVEFWDGSEWRTSAMQPFTLHLDDVFRSGATVREIHDVRELPRA